MTRAERARAAMELLADATKQYGEAALARLTSALVDSFQGPRDERGLLRRGRQAVKLAYLPGLTAKPWHQISDHPRARDAIARLQSQFDTLRSRTLDVVSGGNLGHYQHGDLTDAENKKWRTLFFSKAGTQDRETLSRFPEVSGFISELGEDIYPFGDIFLSVLEPRFHIRPHHDFVNFTLTLHFAISVPPDCTLRVDDETRGWTENAACLFDQSFEHEASNPSDQPRICLLADLWHPQVTAIERQVIGTLAPLFI